MSTMRYDNPFPGMNPYLEQSRFWPGLHNDLIVQIRTRIGPQLPPQYRMEVNERYELDVTWPVDDVASRDIIPDLSVTTERGIRGAGLVPQPSGGVLVATPTPVRVAYLEVRRAPTTRWLLWSRSCLRATRSPEPVGRTTFASVRTSWRPT